jgi:hypothetical protein
MSFLAGKLTFIYILENRASFSNLLSFAFAAYNKWKERMRRKPVIEIYQAVRKGCDRGYGKKKTEEGSG